MQGTGIRFFQVKTEEVKFRVEIPVKIAENRTRNKTWNQEQNMKSGTEDRISDIRKGKRTMAAADNRGKRLSKYVDNYVVFDLETTGISAVKDDIIEISALKVKNHEQVETFSRLVNPRRPIPAGATKVNGITDEMVQSEPGLEFILPEFLDFIDGEILIGHNIQSFDLLFLNRAADEVCRKAVLNDFIDTLFMARALLPGLSRHRLTDLADYFKISSEGAHRAFNDCVMNQICYEHMGKLLKDADIPVCPRCGGELTKRNGKFGPFYGCSNYPACRYTKNIVV